MPSSPHVQVLKKEDAVFSPGGLKLNLFIQFCPKNYEEECVGVTSEKGFLLIERDRDGQHVSECVAR